MIASLFYSFITSPYQFIESQIRYIPPGFAFLCLLLSSTGLVFLSPLTQGVESLIVFAGLTFFLAIILGIQAMILDFIAQFMGRSGHSLPLFFGFCVCYLPLMLFVPLGLLSTSLPVIFDLPLQLIGALLFIFILTLQLKTIKQLYHFSTARSVLILLLPLLIPFFLLVALVSSAGLIMLLGRPF